MASRFCRFQLRTTDVAAARQFYMAVLGHGGDGIAELPAAAAARGAVPHWLGAIDVGPLGGVEQVAARFVARGATRLGPAQPDGQTILRDPGGAVVALCEAGGSSRAGVIWHELNTAEAPRAASNYAELFGWALTEQLDLGRLGSFQQFAWQAGSVSVGAIGDVARRPEVHPHWLFFFHVARLDDVLARARAGGASALPALLLPNGARVAVCDDPQGAAFGLMQPARDVTPEDR